MQIHQLSEDTARYIENKRSLKLEDKEQAFSNYIRHIEHFKKVTPELRILEVGTGTGWFPLLCKLKGLNCKGLEISPQLIEFAKETGERYGVQPDIELGNIEESRIDDNEYDVVVAMSVFEHVEHWRKGLERIYRVLKPGGVMIFESTNKFSPKSGEYTGVPLYGWLPDSVRYALRKKVHGEDIMKLGIDFHQFRYGLLRRTFREIGFRRIADRMDLADPGRFSSPFKRNLARIIRVPPLKHVALTFMPATNFVCEK